MSFVAATVILMAFLVSGVAVLGAIAAAVGVLPAQPAPAMDPTDDTDGNEQLGPDATVRVNPVR